MYIKKILDHNKNPKNFEVIDNYDFKFEKNNSLCGDSIKLYIKINENFIITNASFIGEGCAITIASTSMLTEYLKGKHIDILNNIKIEDYMDVDYCKKLNSRFKCANLAIESFENKIK